jgi:LysR family hydrogen peroxide-inducible transcriptional activator
MELHQFRYFVAVADLGSFTRAAERCLVAQPSLSQQIIKLERELGRPVFERLGRRIRLTEAGKSLYSQAVEILASVDAVRDRVAAMGDPFHGSLALGAIPTVAPYLLPPILRDFGRRFPKASITLHENFTAPLERACMEGEIDLGVTASQPTHEMLDFEPLFTEELLLAAPPKHRLMKRKTISVADLAGEPFIVLNEVHCLAEQVVGFCRQQGCVPSIRCQSSQLLTVQELVALGRGISLIPVMASGKDRGRRCQYRSLSGAKPTRTITAIWRRRKSQLPLVKEVLQLLRAVVGVKSENQPEPR